MCEYCEVIYEINGAGRRFGKNFKKELSYTGEICLSWMVNNGEQVEHELYMNDDECCCDISVPVQYCPKCGRKFNEP